MYSPQLFFFLLRQYSYQHINNIYLSLRQLGIVPVDINQFKILVINKMYLKMYTF